MTVVNQPRKSCEYVSRKGETLSDLCEYAEMSGVVVVPKLAGSLGTTFGRIEDALLRHFGSVLYKTHEVGLYSGWYKPDEIQKGREETYAFLDGFFSRERDRGDFENPREQNLDVAQLYIPTINDLYNIGCDQILEEIANRVLTRNREHGHDKNPKLVVIELIVRSLESEIPEQVIKQLEKRKLYVAPFLFDVTRFDTEHALKAFQKVFPPEVFATLKDNDNFKRLMSDDENGYMGNASFVMAIYRDAQRRVYHHGKPDFDELFCKYKNQFNRDSVRSNHQPCNTGPEL